MLNCASTARITSVNTMYVRDMEHHTQSCTLAIATCPAHPKAVHLPKVNSKVIFLCSIQQLGRTVPPVNGPVKNTHRGQQCSTYTVQAEYYRVITVQQHSCNTVWPDVTTPKCEARTGLLSVVQLLRNCLECKTFWP